jgi:hypothetical protein
MRDTGVEARFSCTCKARRKDAGTARPQNKRRCSFSVILALKEDWVRSHPRLWLVDPHSKNLPSVPESARSAAWVQGGLDPNKISGVGTIFGLLVHVLPGRNKRRVCKQSSILSCTRGNFISPVASFVLGIFYRIKVCVLRGAHLARSIIEKNVE